jgi:hypothetical protein
MILQDVFVLGRSSNRHLTPGQRQRIRDEAGLGNDAVVRTFSRMFANQETIMGTSYRRSRKRMNNVILRVVENEARFFQVHSFSVVEHGVQKRLIALGREVPRVDENFAVPTHIVLEAYLEHMNQSFFRVHPIM